MIILVDMDDTIEEMLVTWIEHVNRKYGRNTTYEDIKEWDVSKAYPGLTRKQVYDVILENDFWKDVKPMEGASEALQRFMERGHKILLVTATPYESLPGKMDHLIFRHFPYFSWEDVIVTRQKQMIRGDVLIDDGPHNLEGGDYAKILLDAPYNRQYDAEANGMLRVYSWDEIERAIEQLEKEQETEKDA